MDADDVAVDEVGGEIRGWNCPTFGTWDPGDGGYVKAFCSECGGQLYTTNPENPEILAIRMGALDGDPGIRPAAHQFVDYAPAWAPVPDDGLPRFPERIDAAALPPDF